jgi:hypothetical protein
MIVFPYCVFFAGAGVLPAGPPRNPAAFDERLCGDCLCRSPFNLQSEIRNSQSAINPHIS